MAVRESVEIDLDRVDRLIQEQEAELEPKHRASIAYREIAQSARGGRRRLLVAGIATARDLHRARRRQPHLGHRRQRVRRLPPRLRGDGRRSCASGDRRGDRTPGAERDAFRAADQAPRRDRREPRGTLLAPVVAVLQLGDRGDARGGPADAREDRSRPPHQDRGHLPRPPRLADVQRDPRSRADGPARSSRHAAAGAGDPAGVRRPRGRGAVQRPGRGPAGVRGTSRPGRRDDRRAGDDELRRHPARTGLPAGSRWTCATSSARTSRSTR